MKTKLTICFTSDTHGYLYSTNFASTKDRPMGVYGIRFPKDGNTLVIDGGDSIQGSPLTYFCRSEHLPMPVAEAFNEREYDVVTLGNHDFNHGPEDLAAYLNALHADCLCANVQDDEKRLKVSPWQVWTMENGLRVGLFGIVTDWVNRWEPPHHLQGLHITDPMAAAAEAVAALQEAGAEVIIGIYHGGIEKNLETGDWLSHTTENIACRLCEALPIDLLLTGHQHIALAGGSWHGTHLVQPPCNAAQWVKITMDEAHHFASELVNVPVATELTEAEVEMRKKLDHWLDTPIGHLSRSIWPEEKLKMAMQGSAIADFFNRVQLAVTGADISCTALANDIRGFAADVTVRDVVASYVYANTLVVLKITGKVLKTALEQCASYFGVGQDGGIAISESFLVPKVSHYNYDYYAGLDYTFDLSRPVGSRVVSMIRNGREIAMEEELSLVMCNYRATGMGHFECFLSCTREREINIEISELILNYLREHPEITIPETHPIHVIR